MRTLRRWDVALGAALVVAVLCVVGCGGGGGSGSSGAPAPTIATITPDEGPGSGGMTVEITGTGFRDGVVVRFDSSHAGDVEVIDAATLRCRTPAHAPGDVDVSVEYGGDSGNVLADGFTYLPGPTITNVSPQEGSEDGDTLVTLTGADFEAGSLVSFGTAPATEVDVNVAGDTLTCRTPEHAPGFVDITVLSPVSGGAIESNAFEFLPVPEIDTCLPGHGVTAGGTSVTVRGSGFTAVTNVTFDGSDAANVDVYSGTVLTCETPGHAAGPVTVRVENCADAFDEVADGYVYSDNEPPTISSVEPASGPRDAQTDITIIGTGFSGSTVWIDGVAATAVVVVSTEEITCKTPVPGKGGPADVTVKNADSVSTTLDGGFTYWPRWVATANLDSGGVSMMALDEDEGTLTLAGVAGVMGPTRIDAGDGYLFVTSAAGVAMYEIDQETGALTCTAVRGTGGTDPVAALYDSANARLFVTNYGSNSVAVFDVDTLAGTLAPVLGSPFSSAGMGPVALSMDPSNSLLFVCNRNSETLVALDIAGSGALSLNPAAQPPAATGSDPRAVVFGTAALGPRLYCLNFGDNTISVFRVNPSGQLVEMPSSPAFGEGNAVSAAEGLYLDDANDRLLVVNQSPPSVSVFYIRDSGRLAEMGESPFATGGSAPLAITVVDDWVLTSQAASDEIAVQDYDSGGAGDLTDVDGSPFDSVGPMPVDIAVDD